MLCNTLWCCIGSFPKRNIDAAPSSYYMDVLSELYESQIESLISICGKTMLLFCLRMKTLSVFMRDLYYFRFFPVSLNTSALFPITTA